MPTKRLVSFIGNRTPSFEGEVQHINPKLFKGRVPALADYVIADDPEIVRVFEEKGVINYGDVQPESNTEWSAGSTSGRSDEPDSSDGRSWSDEPRVDAATDDSHSDGTFSQGAVKNGEAQKEEEQVIPDDWESLPFFTQRSIARKFDPTVNTKDEVVAVLSKQQ